MFQMRFRRQFGSGVWARVDHKPSSDHPQPFLHSHQADAVGWSRWVKSDPEVSNLHAQLPSLSHQPHLDSQGTAVLGSIIQRFLCHAVEAQ